MKLFGRQLFTFKRQPEFMYDFTMHGFSKATPISAYISFESMEAELKPKKKKRGRPPKRITITPSGLYKLSALNDNEFKIKTNRKYLDEQVKLMKDKLSLYPKNKAYELMGGLKYGKAEVKSIIERFGNRKKISGYKNMIEKYPHTSTSLIAEIVEKHDYLKCDNADEFIPDFPREAIKAMKEYNQMCIELCKKKTHFYVIADKKDFGEKNKRRDPILLAQSPFGFFWQILGAWDREMIYLGDL